MKLSYLFTLCLVVGCSTHADKKLQYVEDPAHHCQVVGTNLAAPSSTYLDSDGQVVTGNSGIKPFNDWLCDGVNVFIDADQPQPKLPIIVSPIPVQQKERSIKAAPIKKRHKAAKQLPALDDLSIVYPSVPALPSEDIQTITAVTATLTDMEAPSSSMSINILESTKDEPPLMMHFLFKDKELKVYPDGHVEGNANLDEVSKEFWKGLASILKVSRTSLCIPDLTAPAEKEK